MRKVFCAMSTVAVVSKSLTVSAAPAGKLALLLAAFVSGIGGVYVPPDRELTAVPSPAPSTLSTLPPLTEYFPPTSAPVALLEWEVTTKDVELSAEQELAAQYVAYILSHSSVVKKACNGKMPTRIELAIRDNVELHRKPCQNRVLRIKMPKEMLPSDAQGIPTLVKKVEKLLAKSIRKPS